ncbi:MAG TPA: molybdate ABC transporter substrate-binding protein [Acidimicrobiia bacterium]
MSQRHVDRMSPPVPSAASERPGLVARRPKGAAVPRETHRTRRAGAIRSRAVLLVGLAILGAACWDGKHEATNEAATTAPVALGLAGNLTVLAAASLTDSFNDIGKAFEAANPPVHVKFSYDVSPALATQINSGATADVFASADDANMLKVTAAGNAPRPQTFVRNVLEIVVRKGNPTGIQKLIDFNRANVVYVLCAVGAPCGTYGKQVLDRVGVTRAAASYEPNTERVVSKVTSGQADAGIVYVTDVKAAAADGVALPEDQNVVATYTIAILKQSPHPDLARAFVDYVLSPPGQATLAKYGFLPAR